MAFCKRCREREIKPIDILLATVVISITVIMGEVAMVGTRLKARVGNGLGIIDIVFFLVCTYILSRTDILHSLYERRCEHESKIN